MLVTCSICHKKFLMAVVNKSYRKSDEMAEHEAMHELKGEHVQWIM